MSTIEGKIGNIEKQQNRRNREALDFLDEAMDNVGYDNSFSEEDNIRGYGPRMLERLVDKGYMERLSNGEHKITYEGMRASDLRQDERYNYDTNDE